MPDTKTDKAAETKKTPKYPDVYNKSLILIAAGLAAGLVFPSDYERIPKEAARLADELDAKASSATHVEVAALFIKTDFSCVPNRHTAVTTADNSAGVDRALRLASLLNPYFYHFDVEEVLADEKDAKPVEAKKDEEPPRQNATDPGVKPS